MKYLIILLASLVPTIAFSQAPFQKTYGGTGLDFSYTLDYISADSSYIIGGKTNSAGLGFYDAVLAKTDQAGTIQWIKIIGGIGDDLISSVIQTSNNGFIGAGLTTSFGSGGSDVYIVRTDANGDTLWTRAYGNTMDDWANKIIQTSDGGFLVAGVSEINPGFVYGAYFIKLDAQGDTIWSKIYHSFSYEYANAVIQTSDGGYVFAGNSRGVSNGGFDFFLIKTDALGNVL
ncbi:MAG: hypothetical protein IIA45_14800, partial [Bacteroidetes bacterium]|nr:hypothetical protein [Bacteroidota bacterium]